MQQYAVIHGSISRKHIVILLKKRENAETIKGNDGCGKKVKNISLPCGGVLIKK